MRIASITTMSISAMVIGGALAALAETGEREAELAKWIAVGRSCVWADAVTLDDQISDARSIAAAVYASCKIYIRRGVRAGLPDGPISPEIREGMIDSISAVVLKTRKRSESDRKEWVQFWKEHKSAIDETM